MASSAAAAPLRLVYFRIHGMAARIRLAALVGGVPLANEYVDREAFTALKDAGMLPFGQVPLLYVDGAEPLAQSSAILRFVCRAGGLEPEPSDSLLCARVDALLDHERDTFWPPSVLKYSARMGLASLGDEQKAALLAEVGSSYVPRMLRLLDAHAARSATGWLAGTPAPAACDFAWGTQLRALSLGESATPAAELDALPAVRAFLAKFMELPAVASYYAEPGF